MQDKITRTESQRIARMRDASPMMAALCNNSDNYNDLCESYAMWDELDEMDKS